MFNFLLGMPKILLPNDEYRKSQTGENAELLCDATGFPQVRILHNFKNIFFILIIIN